MIRRPHKSSELSRLEREVFGAPPEAAAELAELWREVFGQPPPVTGAPSLLSRILVENLPPAPPYQPSPKPQAPAEAAPPARRRRGGR